MSDDGVDAGGFPPAETRWGSRRMILVTLTPSGPDAERAEIRTDHEATNAETGRALITVGEMLLADGAPGVTSTGIIIERTDGHG